MKVTVFDTETTGLVKYKLSPCDPAQPFPVSIGAVTYNYLTGEVTEFYTLVRIPDNVEIEAKAQEIHGISREKAAVEGVTPEKALQSLEGIFAESDLIEAYNLNFDSVIYKTLDCYVNGPRDYVTQPYYSGKKTQCLMNISAREFRIPRKSGVGYQPLKLEQAYKRLVGCDMLDAHNALSDAKAAMDIRSVLLARSLPDGKNLEYRLLASGASNTTQT